MVGDIRSTFYHRSRKPTIFCFESPFSESPARSLVLSGQARGLEC